MEAAAAPLAIDLAPGRDGGLRLRNPVLAAAGTFGWGVDYGPVADVGRLGAIITNGVTVLPQKAAPSPRVAEVPGGMLSAGGWANPGVAEVVARYAQAWASSDPQIIVNVVPGNAAEARDLAQALQDATGAAALEVDVTDAIARSQHPDHVGRVVHTLREAWSRPLIVKLPGFGVDVISLAARMEQVGADALSVINAVPGVAIDAKRRRPVLPSVSGRLSGPAVKSIALHFVWEVSRAVSIPVIGVGGVSTEQDALEFFMAGAQAVQVGSASFRNPRASLQIIDGLAAYLERNGLVDIHALIGAARPV